MPLVLKVNGVTLPHRVRLNDGTNNGIDGLTSAADGSGSMGGVIIDDPNHDLVLQGWQTVIVEESDCTTAPRLFTGFVGDRTTTHGNYPTDGGRQFNVTIYDQNVLLSWALITGADGKRPVESRTARIDWLLGSPYLDTIVFDTGFVVPSGASDFDEADYRGQYPRDVLDDVLGAFQVAFAFWDEAADKIGLFYDAMTAATRDSTLTISNDPADQDFSTCWPPYVEAELAQDPSNVYSLERLTYTNGLLLRERPATKAQFFPSPYPDRGQATDRSRIGKAVTADHYIDALLEQASAEDETVTCTLLLPSTHVGLVDAGQRISVKFVHLDGYEDFVYTRITSRTTRQALGRSDLYEVQLTLNQRGPFGGGGGGGGSNPPPTTFPPGPITPVHFYEGALSFQSDGYGTGHVTGVGAVIPNTTNSSTNTAAVTFVMGITYNYSFTIAQTGGDNPPSVGLGTDSGNDATSLGMPFTTGTGSGTQTFTGSFTPTIDVSNVYAYFATGALGHPVGGRTTIGTWVIDPVGWDPGTPVDLSPGQENQRPEVVTMSGADGTTLWPFANGTLKVFVDDTDQTGAITAQDGAAGTFTLGFTPFVGEVVTVEYVGR
jgi:hypothetical protein